jgi:MarR family transcriptional regulator, organic hydroperoxide resistance regulator
MPKPISFGFDSPYNSPGFLLWRVSAAWQRSIRESLEPLGLTHAQFVFVAATAWQQTGDASHGSGTQAQLAQVIGERRSKPSDARAMTLTLTKEGLEVARRALPLVNAADAKFFESLEGTPEFIAELRRLIGVP